MTTKQWTDRLRDVLAVLGVASALLSILFGARSAYLYFAAQSAQTSELESWLKVAEDRSVAPAKSFGTKLAHLEEVAFALEQAMILEPANRELQRLSFMSTAILAYTDLENRPLANDGWHEHLAEVTAVGWRISSFVMTAGERASLLEALARLETWRAAENSSETTINLLREAVDLAPDDPGLQLQLAKHLLETRSGAEEGMGMLRKLVEDDPENPSYLVRLGNQMALAGETKLAIDLLERTILLHNVNESWEFEQARLQSRSALFSLVQDLIAKGEPPNTRASDSVMDDYYSTTWYGKGLAGLYWWARGSREQALRNFVASDLEFRRESVPKLLEEELDWFGMNRQDLKPSRAEMEGTQVHANIAGQFSLIAGDVESYIASIEEAVFLEPGSEGAQVLGAQVQHWPGEGLLLRRVVPGFWLANAGARPNDWVSLVNGKELVGLKGLRAMLAEGTLNSVTVTRGGESLTLPYSD